MKLTMRVVATCVSILFLYSFISRGDIAPPTEMWKEGVVAIDFMGREATGMYVDTHLVLTAAHLTKTGVWRFYGCYPFWGWSPTHDIIRMTPVYIDVVSDVLLLRTDKAAKFIFQKFAAPKPDEQVWVVGYQYGFLSCERAGIAKSVSVEVYVIDQRIAPLGSGSPIVNAAGCVMGMIVATDDYFSYFVPAGTLSNAIERHQRTNDQKQERN